MLDAGSVVVEPSFPRGDAFREEKDVCTDTVGIEDASRKSQNRMQVALIHQVHANTLTVTIGKKNIHEFCEMSVEKARDFVDGLKFTPSETVIAKEIIKEVARNFSAAQTKDLSLVLPESLRAGLEPFVKNELSNLLGKGVQAEFSKKVAGGFRIGPGDGSYFISMTDETFKALIAEYLRPTARKLLFEEE